MNELRAIRIGVAVVLMALGLAWWLVNMPGAVFATLGFLLGVVILRSHVHVLRKTLASIKFCPDCGGDWCHLVDERVAEPLSGPGDCAEKGYCKAFMEIERKRDAALAATETKES